jgi:hypothetical protein
MEFDAFTKSNAIVKVPKRKEMIIKIAKRQFLRYCRRRNENEPKLAG